jgi:predicted DNA binding CopG/RHH family protein
MELKQIIDGVTYDTDTAKEVVVGADGSPFNPASTIWAMYQTRHGAFFKVTGRDQKDGETKYSVTPLTDDEARRILEEHANDLVEQYFGTLPEYGSAERRITLRIPIDLARRVEAAAASASLDLFTYIQVALEKATTADGHPPTKI